MLALYTEYVRLYDFAIDRRLLLYILLYLLIVKVRI